MCLEDSLSPCLNTKVHLYGMKSLHVDSSPSLPVFPKIIYSSIPESHWLHATLWSGEKINEKQTGLPWYEGDHGACPCSPHQWYKEGRQRSCLGKKNHLEQGHHEDLAKWFYVVQVKIAKPVTLV